MNREAAKSIHNLAQRRGRIRSKVVGSPDRPRLSLKISNMHISAQVIDDSTSTTLASASTVGKNLKGSLGQKAESLGKELAAAAKAKGISKVVFDRNGKKYHGRIKSFADSARQSGLDF
jgi:large subunit ribosomal protein L18